VRNGERSPHHVACGSSRGPARSNLRTAGAAAIVALLALVLAACARHDSSAGRDFEPTEPGTHVVATPVLPAPGLWEELDGGAYEGFEAELADAIAERLELEEVRIVQVPFAEIAAGRFTDVDVAISQLTPTAERDEVLDFTVGYLDASPGVLVRAGIEARDARQLRALRWTVLEGSTLTDIVEERVRPEAEPLAVTSRADSLAAIADGEADAVLLDLPVAQALARAEPDEYEVAGQLSGTESLALAVPDGSPNLDALDAAVRALIADGTVERLAERWLGNAGDVPLIRVRP
jgi:polar amino acid transport system substrate-binding protein